LLHRRGGKDTSRQAAYSVNTAKWEMICCRACMQMMPNGITTTECSIKVKHTTHSISARWSGLVRKSLVYDSGERRKSSITGRKQIVWKINPFVIVTETGDIILTMKIERLAKDETPPLDDKWQPINFDKARLIFEDNFINVKETLEAIDAGREIETNFFYYRAVNRES